MGCGTSILLQGGEVLVNDRLVHANAVFQFRRTPGYNVLTCGVLLGDGASVEHGSILGDGPHLVGSTDGDGLEGLVGAHVQPGAALEDRR